MSLSIGVVGLPNVGPTSRLLKKGLRPLLSVHALLGLHLFVKKLNLGGFQKCRLV